MIERDNQSGALLCARTPRCARRHSTGALKSINLLFARVSAVHEAVVEVFFE